MGSSIRVVTVTPPQCPQLPKSMDNYEYWFDELTQVCKEGLTDIEMEEFGSEVRVFEGSTNTEERRNLFGQFVREFVTKAQNRIDADNALYEVSKLCSGGGGGSSIYSNRQDVPYCLYSFPFERLDESNKEPFCEAIRKNRNDPHFCEIAARNLSFQNSLGTQKRGFDKVREHC